MRTKAVKVTNTFNEANVLDDGTATMRNSAMGTRTGSYGEQCLGQWPRVGRTLLVFIVRKFSYIAVLAYPTKSDGLTPFPSGKLDIFAILVKSCSKIFLCLSNMVLAKRLRHRVIDFLGHHCVTHESLLDIPSKFTSCRSRYVYQLSKHLRLCQRVVLPDQSMDASFIAYLEANLVPAGRRERPHTPPTQLLLPICGPVKRRTEDSRQFLEKKI